MENQPEKSFRTLLSNEVKTCENFIIPQKSVTPIMTQQITPPAHVWSRIEKILDEQDERRKSANEIIAKSFRNTYNSSKQQKFFVAAGVSLVAAIFWATL